MATLEYTIIASIPPAGIDIGPPGASLTANVETYNGDVPGPTIEADVGDTVIVRLINNLPHPTGIHWHGIELQNNADGTPVTQNGLPGAPLQTLGNGVPAGGTYLYKFDVPRAGIFWYHPHHFHSTNRVFRGLYGMIVVTDPAVETPLVGTILPADADTHQVVLSDMTVCAAPGATPPNNPATSYEAPVGGVPEWLSGETMQLGPTPLTLCETDAMDEDGSSLGAAFGSGDIPNIQRSGPGRTVEGNIVLANGRNHGGRLGTPDNPGALSGTNILQNVAPGQGLRLQFVNCAHLRYFRLRLTGVDTDGNSIKIDLKRIGGEGGLLDQPILEGTATDGFEFKYDEGEILIPPSARADVVAEIPTNATGTLTLWTRDFQRAGGNNPGNWALLPTVPVMHFAVTLAAVPAYSLPLATPLRPGNPVPTLPATATALLDPATFGEPGEQSSTIVLNAAPGTGAQIDNETGHFSVPGPYTSVPHIASSRYATANQTIELKVQNTTQAHHPFHLHGFSFQPTLLELAGQPDFDFPNEFKDTQDIPAGATLTFRIDTSDRPLNDGLTMGGAFGRWLFHCHIFFHAHTGMISELVITRPDGSERPYVNVGGSWEYTPEGGVATRSGTFVHPDGKIINLIASDGNLSFPPGVSAGSWQWNFDSTGEPNGVRYVYITATDPDGQTDQTVFRLKIGAPDDGSDTGDPHLRSVDGTRFDFQAVGEFVLLRDDDGMEVQTRQTPVETANPIQDSHSGLRVCVSLNTAMAARVGNHRISYQPGREPGELIFYLNGKPSKLDPRGIDLDGHRVSGFDADGRTGLRIDYAHHAVVTVTPRFWNSHGVHYLNVDVSRTQADRGLMAPLAPGSWLPRTSAGMNLGPRPDGHPERFDQLYRVFADSWRVTDRSSLFTYLPGSSTETFTDRGWPAEEPPCRVKPELAIPDAPELKGMPVEDAKKICEGVTDDDLFANCVFDVATTGDESFAEGYLFQQELAERSTAVQIVTEDPDVTLKDRFKVIAIVSALRPCHAAPTGSVTFFVDDEPVSGAIDVDKHGRATFEVTRIRPGRRIRAEYSGCRGDVEYRPSMSPSLIHPVDDRPEESSGTNLAHQGEKGS